MKLSVIIPVYNVEQTLEQCVESILQQDVEDSEIILVDDGSPDNCPQLCDKLEQQFQKIRTIHRENGGLSAARNTGISHSQGEFITFVDSDDWLEQGTLSSMLEILHKNPRIDILEYPVDIKGKSVLQLEEATFNSVTNYWTQTHAYEHTYAWNKIYRSSLFKEVSFPEGKVFEDVWTFPQLLQRSRVVATTNQGLYHYTNNPSGITAKARGSELTSLLEAHLNCPLPTPLIYLLNIQLDVFRLTGRILLPDGLKATKVNSFTDKIKILIYKHLGIKKLCMMHKMFKAR